MNDDSHHDYVSTSHYHLPLRHVIGVVFVCALVLCAILFFLFLFAAVRSKVDTEKFIVPPPPSMAEALPALLPPNYRGSAVSFIYPPEYEMRDTQEPERPVGSLASYVFSGGRTADGKAPFLRELSLYTGDSLVTSGLGRESFDTEKISFEQDLDIEDRQISSFNDRKYYVYNTDEGLVIRHYVTFIHGTRIEIRIGMSSSSLSMQADELFRLVHVVSKIEEQDATIPEEESVNVDTVSIGFQ